MALFLGTITYNREYTKLILRPNMERIYFSLFFLYLYISKTKLVIHDI